jgi:hypothetical protein
MLLVQQAQQARQQLQQVVAIEFTHIQEAGA